MTGSLILYGSVSLLTALSSEISARAKNKIIRSFAFLFTLLIPSFVAGIRYGIGTDYFNYKFIFEKIKYGYEVRPEIGYKLINHMVAISGGNIQHVFFIVSFLTILFVYLTLSDHKEKISVGLGMLVFMLIYYQLSYNAVRHVLAMSIGLYSVKYIFKRRFFKYTIFILLAMSFHLSSVLMFPFYYIYKLIGVKKRAILKTLFFISVVLFMINYDKILYFIINKIPAIEYYSIYLKTKDNVSFGFGIFILNIPYILPGLIYYNQLKEYDDRFIFYYELLLVGFLLKFMSYFAADYISRVSDIFFISIIIIIPYYFKILKRRKNLVVLNIFLIAFLFFMWIFTYFYSGKSDTVPFKSIFFR